MSYLDKHIRFFFKKSEKQRTGHRRCKIRQHQSLRDTKKAQVKKLLSYFSEVKSSISFRSDIYSYLNTSEKFFTLHSLFIHENKRPKQKNNSRGKKKTKKTTNPNIPEIKLYLLNPGILETKLVWIREVHCKMQESIETFLFLCSLTISLLNSSQNPISQTVLKWNGKANMDWNRQFAFKYFF